MSSKINFLLLLTALCSFGSLAANSSSVMLEEDSSSDLIVYNRILAKVNGKTVSVLDVMKRMDLFLQKNYPHLADSKMARYQFYSSQWRDYLSQIIDHELMIADAEKLEVKITEAEVREEVMSRFGPNIMPTLDKLGLTYEEAKQMIHDEMIVQRMTWFRINSKALANVNSQDVKEAYKQYCAKNPEIEQWQYQVLSIRSNDKATSESLASKAFELLGTTSDLSSVSEKIKSSDESITISLSDNIEADEKSISASHREALSSLTENSFSPPILQESRATNSLVYRIFYLKKHTKTKLPSFNKVADTLKEELLQQAAIKESTQYIQKLRERLGYDEKHMVETLPSDFQPFAIK